MQPKQSGDIGVAFNVLSMGAISDLGPALSFDAVR
jgi:hypothetical protein